MNLLRFSYLIFLPVALGGLGWRSVPNDEGKTWLEHLGPALRVVQERLERLKIVVDNFVVSDLAEFPPLSVYASIHVSGPFDSLYIAIRFDSVVGNPNEYVLGYMPTMFDMEKANRAYVLSQNKLGGAVEMIGASRGFTSTKAAQAYFTNYRKDWDFEEKNPKRLVKFTKFCDLLKSTSKLHLSNATIKPLSSFRYESNTEVYHYVVFQVQEQPPSSSSSSSADTVLPNQGTKVIFHTFKRTIERALGAALQHISLREREYSVVDSSDIDGMYFVSQVFAEDVAMQTHAQNHCLKWVAFNALEDGDPLKSIVTSNLKAISDEVKSHVKPISVYVHPNKQPSIYVICQDVEVNVPFTFARLGSVDLKENSGAVVQYVKNIGRFGLSKFMHYLKYSSEDEAEEGTRQYLKEHDSKDQYSGRFAKKCEIRSLIPDTTKTQGYMQKRRTLTASGACTDHCSSNYHVILRLKINSEVYAQVLFTLASKMGIPFEQLSVLSETICDDSTYTGTTFELVKHLHLIVKRVIPVVPKDRVEELNQRLAKWKGVEDQSTDSGWQIFETEAALGPVFVDYLKREDVNGNPTSSFSLNDNSGNDSGLTHHSYLYVKVGLRGKKIFTSKKLVAEGDMKEIFDVTDYKIMYVQSGASVEKEIADSILRPRWEDDENGLKKQKLKVVNNISYEYPPLRIAILAAEEYVTKDRQVVQNQVTKKHRDNEKDFFRTQGVEPHFNYKVSLKTNVPKLY